MAYTRKLQSIIDSTKDLTTAEKYQLALALVDGLALSDEQQQIKHLLQICTSENKAWEIAIREKNSYVVLSDKLLDLVQLLGERLFSRDRKSAPDTMKQDEEIHSLRTGDSKKWSWAMLARKYDMTSRAAQKAFARHVERLQDAIDVSQWKQRLTHSSNLDDVIEFVDKTTKEFKLELGRKRTN